MKKIILLLSVLTLAFGSHLKAQIAGTFSVPATYTSIAAAINDLNAQGVNGPVTILVDAGYTETAPLGGFTFTATGTLANPITFQKNGVGSNPQIMAYTGGTATPASAIQDGVWKFIGSDYITIDGIDIFDQNNTNPGTMEYGYGFFKASATDGCQNNTIKNCNISLSNANNALGTSPSADGSRGIYLANALYTTNTTIVTVTSASGTNSNNKFYTNTIQNCNIGIAIMGYAATTPFTNADQNNDIGGSSAATGNTIVNYGGGGTTAAAVGVRTLAQYSINVSYNVINNNNGSGTNHAQVLKGIILGASTSANASITNNTITLKGGGTSALVNPIENASGSTAASNTITINNNLIANGTNSTTTTGIYYGIYNTASCAYLNVANNTFTNNTSNATSGATYLIYNTGAVASSNNITNNTLSHSFTGATAYTGTMYNIYNLGGSVATSLNISGNNFASFNHVNVIGTGAIYFIYNTSSSANLTLNANKWDGLVMNHSGGEYFMYNSSSTQSALAVTNNSITNYVRNAAANTMYCYYAGSSSLPTSTQTFSGNIFSNITATVSGTGTFYGIFNSDGGTSPYPRKSVFSNTITNVNMSNTGTTYGLYTQYMGDGSGSSGSSMYNNVIDNITAAGTMYLLYNGTLGSPAYPASVYSNTVSNITSLGNTSSIFSAYVFGGGAGTNFYKNRIHSISQNGTSGNAYGIYASTSPTTNIYNNLVGNIATPNSGNINALNGIYIGGGTNINVYYNTVYLNGTSAGLDFGSSAVYASTTPNVNLRNNIFVNLSTANGTGLTAAYRRSSATLTTYSSTSNNNLFYAGTPTASNVIFFDGTNTYQTIGAYIGAVSPRDANSVTENPNFVSVVGTNANFLNINAGTPTQIESGASPISGINDDYAGTIRNVSTPDIGAWEGNYTSLPVCSGTPASNTTVANSTLICLGANLNLGLSNPYLNQGITYQWQMSTTSASGPFTNISGANAAYYSTNTTTTTTWFQVVVTCTNGGASITSAPVQVNINTNPCQCASYCNSNASLTADDEIFNVTIGTLNNTSTCGQTGGPGSLLSQYSNYSGTLSAPALVAGAVYPFSVTVGQCGGVAYSGGVVIYMDLNQNGVFTDVGEMVFSSPITTWAIAGTVINGNITIPSTASVGITRMRVIAAEGITSQASCGTYGYGETEDYCIDIMAPVPCSGAPAANNAVATQTSVCPSGSVTLSLANTYTIGGLSYQWSSSTSSVGPWTPITNATLTTYAATSLTTSTWFQAVITCTNGGATTTATPVQVMINNNPCQCASYCSSAASIAADDELFNVSIGTLNNTSSCSQTGGPGSTLSLYSNYTGIVAAPTLTINNTYTLSVTAGQCGGVAYSGIVLAYIDFNQNGVFTDVGEAVFTSTYGPIAVAGITYTTNVTIPLGAVPGTTRMRVICIESSTGTSCGTYGYGETEDYCVVIDPGPPCTAASGGTISSAAINACDTQTLAITTTSASTGAGISYQWMVSNTPGGPYSAVTSGSGTATTSYTTPVMSPTVAYYVLQTTCTTASLTGISNEATLTINPNPTVVVSPGTGSVCFPGGTPVSLTASGASTYSWLPLAGLSATTGANVNALPAGTVVYTVTGASAVGCTGTGTATISALEGPSILTITATPSLVCSAGSSSLNSAGALTSSYTITGIPYAAIPTPSSGVTNLCVNGTTVLPLSGGNLDDGGWANLNLPFSFNYFGSGYSSFAIGTNGFLWLGSGAPNTYFGVGTAFPAVSAARPAIGSVYADLDFDGVGSGSTIEYFVTGTSPNQKLVVNWNGQFWPNTGTVTTQAILYENSNIIEVHTFTSTGNQSAVEGIQDATGTTAYVVTGRNAVTWSVTTADAYRWSPNGGPVTYSWTPATFLSSTNISNPVATNINATTAYSVVITGTNGCSNTGTINITVDQAPTLSVVASPTMLCLSGATTGITASGASTYSWSTGATTSSIVESPTVTTTYSVVGTSTAGCTASTSIAITVGGSPSITATAGTGTVCAGGSTALNANGASTYTWNTGATGNIIAVTPSTTTTYTVTGDNGSGCVGTATVDVFVNPLPTVSLSAGSTTACTNGPTIALTGSPAGGAYTGTNVTTGVFTPGATAGTFVPGYAFTNTVTGCSNSASVTIIVSVCTDINSKVSSLKGLAVYPNPNLGEFTVELANGLNKTIELTDLTGRIILTESTTNDKLNVNISTLANGVYFVKVQSNNTVEIIKLIKQ